MCHDALVLLFSLFALSHNYQCSNQLNILPDTALTYNPIHLQVTKEEYARSGSMKLGEAVAEKLRAQGKNPYLVPVSMCVGICV